MSAYLESDAVISDCGRYRYLLRRTWDFAMPRALVCMLNPSTADAEADDPTIRSLRRLLAALGYGSFEVVNLYAWRATDPKDLAVKDGEVDLIGQRNSTVIESAAGRCDLPVCAWGANQLADRRARGVWHLIRSYRPAVFCFGQTKGGAPKHPLYIKTGTPLQEYRP